MLALGTPQHPSNLDERSIENRSIIVDEFDQPCFRHKAAKLNELTRALAPLHDPCPRIITRLSPVDPRPRLLQPGLAGWQNEDARNGIETHMRALAKGLEKDPALDRALTGRRGQLGLGPRQALEWSPGSRSGDVGRELADRTRGRSVTQALMDSLGSSRSRDAGLSL